MASDEENDDNIFDEVSSDTSTDDVGGGLFDDVDEAVGGGVARVESSRGTVKIGKKTYAVGLIWQTASDGEDVVAEAKLAAKDDTLKANTFCVRESATIQYGLGRKAMGHRSGMPALAAVVADKLTGNWLAAFEIDNDIYLAAVRDGQILSDYDRLLGQVRQARDLFSDLLYSAEWDAVLAPASWNVDEADPSKIDTYLTGGNDFRLKTTGAGAKSLVLLLGVAGVAAGGYFFMQPAEPPQDWSMPTDFAPVDVQEDVDASDEEQGVELPVEQPPTPPWIDRPNGVGMLIACTDDIRAATVEVPGWATESVSCSNSDIRLTLSRVRGTVLWAQEYLRGLGHEANLASQAGSGTLIHQYPASFVSPYTTDIQTRPLREVREYLGLQFDEREMEITFSEPDSYTDSIIDRYYERSRFSFETMIDPLEFVEILTPIPALLLNEVSYDIDQKIWSVSGQYYSERPVPIPPPAPEGAPVQN